MNRNLFRTAILLASLVIVTPGYAATISWNLPTSYSDGTPIDAADAENFLVKIYASSEKTGPWKWVATSLPGARSVMVPDPPPWQTLWYTATSSLHGAESDFAAPVRKTNFILPIVLLAKKVMKKMITVKKMTALFLLLLLGGLVWFFRYRGKKEP